VLGTPRLLAWAEEATCEAVAPYLDGSSSSVGTGIRLDHRRPSPLRTAVQVSAELVEVDGRRLRFEVSAAHQDGDVVARGEVTRAVVDRARFLERTAPPS
jgi:fluoroacetyl-CoA thioesterase